MNIDLVEFIHRSNNVKHVDELVTHFLSFLNGFGLNRFVMSSMGHDRLSEKAKNHGILVNFPSEWMAHYQANQYLEDDGIYKKAMLAKKPFTWSSVHDDPQSSAKSVRILDEAYEFKLYDGIGLSIHRPYGEIIGMGLAGADKGVECNPDILSQVYAAANQFYLVYDELAGTALREEIRLTPREKEVLLWLARGKSMMDIGDILQVSIATIKYHCINIYKKLNTCNGKMAVMKAIRMGLIQPY